MKLTVEAITQNVLAIGGSQYKGPGGFVIPLVWLSKRMPVQFNRLETKLKLSEWEGAPMAVPEPAPSPQGLRADDPGWERCGFKRP